MEYAAEPPTTEEDIQAAATRSLLAQLETSAPTRDWEALAERARARRR